MNLKNKTGGEITSAKIDINSLPAQGGTSFCWCIASILRILGKDTHQSDVRGFSLSAFSIWAHPAKDIKLWREPCAHLFTTLLLDSLALKGELLNLPEGTRDHLGYFLHHWAGMVKTYLNEGIPLGAMEVWPESLWGIVTSWDPAQRVLKGYIPDSINEINNRCWPTKLLLIGKKPLRQGLKTPLKTTLRNVSALGSNRIRPGNWASGIDAYLVWRKNAAEGFDYNAGEHLNLASNLSEARKHAAFFLARHADLGVQGTDRMMCSLTRRYNKVSSYLSEAANAPGKQSFINSLTAAAAEEEKALALVDELLVRLD
ncbi:hypothetical protein GF359_01070 [candidate division WOR-3 bacterium]|uniref:Uncharacterized protein n=1 Tax=candidate division WOR-3 bacterium TaxID=2052148 RepID=A0A9D5K7Z0_UNCW3|nr:hypothetical protein [candidate division WOR-3 bacterium]MBD3363785.1 hypothetical protein [candidate division WOR-3 bacterium]